MISNNYENSEVSLPRNDLQGRTRRRVLEKVIQKVDKYLLDEDVIDADQWQIRRDLDSNRSAAESMFEPCCSGAHDFLERIPVLFDVDSGFEPCHFQEIGDDPVHSFHFGGNPAHKFSAIHRIQAIFFLQKACRSTVDCSEGRFDVMRNCTQ